MATRNGKFISVSVVLEYASYSCEIVKSSFPSTFNKLDP
jgi:hypothetical protein